MMGDNGPTDSHCWLGKASSDLHGNIKQARSSKGGGGAVLFDILAPAEKLKTELFP